MKLHYKINLTSLSILLTVTTAIAISGYFAITQISYTLNEKLMGKEVHSIKLQIQEAIDVLQQSGVASVPSYIEQAKNELLNEFNHYHVSNTGHLLIVDKSSGEVLTKLLFLNAEDQALLRQIGERGRGVGNYSFGGFPTFFYYDSFEDWGWSIIFTEQEQKILEVRRTFLENVLLILLTSIVIGGIVIVWTTSKIVNPLRQLAGTANDISQGNLNAPLPEIKGTDEIAQLTTSFRDMSKNLAVTYQNLKDNLHKVEESQAALVTEKERLAITLGSIGDSVISTDAEGKITLLNSVAEKVLGIEKKRCWGRSLDEVLILNGDGDIDSVGYSPLSIFSNKTVSSFEGLAILPGKDDEQLTISATASPMFNQEGVYLGLILVFRDITEQIKIQEELMKAHKLESVGILAGGIAHDFNNILTGILGNLSLAKLDADENSELLERVEEAEQASHRAKGLTTQLLTFSKGGKPVKTTVSLAELIREASSFALTGSNCLCNLEVVPLLWKVDADGDQITQVIHNLVINGCQAMPKGGTISIKCENQVIDEENPYFLSPGNYVRFSVADTGNGISREELTKIFDPYYTTKENGSGLGLASAYSIIKNHLGHIEVISDPGKRTEFVCFLPASEEKALVVEEKLEQLTSGAGRILIMDDEKMVRQVTGRMLKTLGYTSDVAEDGDIAIRKYQEAMEEGAAFDMVIMDLTIPGGMGGEEAIKHLLQIDPDVKAIVSSGYANNPVIADYEKYGFCAVISKPFSISQLSAALAEVQTL